MALIPNTLRPGLLVSLKSQVSGNVSYQRKDLEPEYLTEDGQARARWETERWVEDPAEHVQACKVRSEARACVSRICTVSSFGLLCPESRMQDLEDAITTGRALIDTFNAQSRRSKLALYVLVGRIAADDIEAARALNSEVSALMESMERGLTTLDVSMVRDAASKARNLEAMLTAPAAGRIKTAVATARQAARQIVKAGEQGAAAIDEVAIAKIAACRTAFLDIPDTGDEEESAISLGFPSVAPRLIDLEPIEPEPSQAEAQIEMMATYLATLAAEGPAAIATALTDGRLTIELPELSEEDSACLAIQP